MNPCIPKSLVSERGVDAASLSLLPQLSLNSSLVGSFPLKRPEGRAPTNRQLVDAPSFHIPANRARSNLAVNKRVKQTGQR